MTALYSWKIRQRVPGKIENPTGPSWKALSEPISGAKTKREC